MIVQTEKLEQMLKAHPFFEGFDPKTLKDIVGCASFEEFEAGESIFKEGGKADRFYLISHGNVALEVEIPSRERLVIETLHDGEILGWSWLVPPYRWSTSARSMSVTRTTCLNAQCVISCMESNPELGYRLLQRILYVLSDRFRAARIQLMDIYAPALPSDR